MDDLKQFGARLPEVTQSHVERAVGLLWFYRQTQAFEERSARELAADLHELGFPRPNVTRLSADLRKSKLAVKGRRDSTFQLDARKVNELDQKFSVITKTKIVPVSDAVLPSTLVSGTRPYLEKLVAQINGCYDKGWYDGCAVLCRRLVESLIIETYLTHSSRSKIEVSGSFKMLDALIATIKNETSFKIGRNSGKAMNLVKEVGDTAAHDRTYLTQMQDIDDLKVKLRRLIGELLALAKITAS